MRYHVVDCIYLRTKDAQMVGAYPVWGREWMQAFKVDQDDNVMIRIGDVWGVDDCPYCKDMVFLNGISLGRIFASNNHKSFVAPIAFPVKKGKTYTLTIASVGKGKVDNWLFENVTVETVKARLTFLQPGPVLKNPGEPEPVFREPPAVPSSAGPCDDLQESTRWLLPRDQAAMDLSGPASAFVSTSPVAELQPGQTLSFSFFAGQDQSTDLVSQELDILLDDGKPSGWVFSFAPGSPRMIHGNLMLDERYTSRFFEAPGFRAGQWNQARISWCRDGRLHLSINGQGVSQSFASKASDLPLRLRALGLEARFRTGSKGL